MSEKITVPTLGESVTEATVSKWLKSVGEEVITDEPIVELETDKVNVEVPSPSNGVLENISVNEGDTVQVGTLLGSVVKNSSDSVNVKKEKEYTPPKKQEEAMLYLFPCPFFFAGYMRHCNAPRADCGMGCMQQTLHTSHPTINLLLVTCAIATETDWRMG